MPIRIQVQMSPGCGHGERTLELVREVLGNIVTIALRSAPGPANAGRGGVPNTAIAEVPFVWLPAFLVPVAVFGHVASLRRLAIAARGPGTPALDHARSA
jgi:hypothetical protein